MITGATVIFNDEYIDEVTRHRDIAKKKFEVEDLPEKKEQAQKAYESWEKKLDWSLNFQDVVDRVINCEVPNITVIKTMTGYELPAKILQTV